MLYDYSETYLFYAETFQAYKREELIVKNLWNYACMSWNFCHYDYIFNYITVISEAFIRSINFHEFKSYALPQNKHHVTRIHNITKLSENSSYNYFILNVSVPIMKSRYFKSSHFMPFCRFTWQECNIAFGRCSHRRSWNLSSWTIILVEKLIVA
jgi:hypothetical protein